MIYRILTDLIYFIFFASSYPPATIVQIIVFIFSRLSVRHFANSCLLSDMQIHALDLHVYYQWHHTSSIISTNTSQICCDWKQTGALSEHLVLQNYFSFLIFIPCKMSLFIMNVMLLWLFHQLNICYECMIQCYVKVVLPFSYFYITQL